MESITVFVTSSGTDIATLFQGHPNTGTVNNTEQIPAINADRRNSLWAPSRSPCRARRSERQPPLQKPIRMHTTRIPVSMSSSTWDHAMANAITGPIEVLSPTEALSLEPAA